MLLTSSPLGSPLPNSATLPPEPDPWIHEVFELDPLGKPVCRGFFKTREKAVIYLNQLQEENPNVTFDIAKHLLVP